MIRYLHSEHKGDKHIFIEPSRCAIENSHPTSVLFFSQAEQAEIGIAFRIGFFLAVDLDGGNIGTATALVATALVADGDVATVGAAAALVADVDVDGGTVGAAAAPVADALVADADADLDGGTVGAAAAVVADPGLLILCRLA